MLIQSGIALHLVLIAASFRPVSQYLPSTYKRYLSNNPTSANDTDQHKKPYSRLFTQFSTKLSDFSLFRTIPYVLFLLGTFLSSMGFSSVPFHIPNRAVFYSIDRSKVALLPTYGGIATAVAKILFGAVASLKCTNRHAQYGVGTIVGGIVTVFSTVATTYLTISFFYG